MKPASEGRLGQVSWILDKGIPSGTSTGLSVVGLGRSTWFARIQCSYAAAHPTHAWGPCAGLLLKGNEYKGDENMHFNEALVLIINCGRNEWTQVVEW